ncbi:MAG: DUF1638 domain-containing protein [Desulfobacterales bacterium]|jgi:hypothetical protein
MSSSENIPVVIIACRVLQSVLEQFLPDELAERSVFMDYGLHRVPAKMTRELQDTIDAIQEPSRVVLGYGLCGNGLEGIGAGKHTLLIPKVDDCIAILLGSRHDYVREFTAVPGTYYLSKGWLESGSHPLKEYQEYAQKYGAEEAAWIMDQQYRNYERLVLVAHSQSDLEAYRPQALEVARYCEQWGMRYEEILGSDRYVRKLIEIMNDPAKGDNEFIVVAPGEQIRQQLFWDFEMLDPRQQHVGSG